MRRLFTFKSAGSCKRIGLLILAALILSLECQAETWQEYSQASVKQIGSDRINGYSYIISGALGLAGGIAGANITQDPLEKGVYALFQTIGVASIGYGFYQWKIGDQDRLMFLTLKQSPNLSDEQRMNLVRSYRKQVQISTQSERKIKAIVHGLIAALNIYNGSQQGEGPIKSSLYFIGAANVLAAASFTFTFE